MEIKNLFSFASSLSGVNRFSMVKLSHPENVLEHTGMVCIFAYVLTQHINARIAHRGGHLSLGTVLTRATVHDWDEVITGDIPRPTKYYSKELRECFVELERIGLRKIAAMLDTPNAITDHEHSKSGVEGAVVAVADLLAAVHRVWEEVFVYNNMHLVRPAHHMRRALIRKHKVLGELYAEEDRQVCGVLCGVLEEGIDILNAVCDKQPENVLGEISHED